MYLTDEPDKPLEEWKTFDVADLDDPKKILNRGELEPETPYYVRIAAENPDGLGVVSDVVAFSTLSGGLPPASF